MVGNFEQLCKRGCSIINYILHPILMPLYFFTIIIFSTPLLLNSSYGSKFLIIIIVSAITIIVPIVSVSLSRLIAILMKENTTSKEVSLLLSVILFISYIASIFLIKNYISLQLTLRIMLAPIILVILYNIFEKIRFNISLWIMSIGAITTYIYLFRYYGVTGLDLAFISLVILTGVLASCRIYLNKDNILSISLGFVWGSVISIISFFIGGIF